MITAWYSPTTPAQNLTRQDNAMERKRPRADTHSRTPIDSLLALPEPEVHEIEDKEIPGEGMTFREIFGSFMGGGTSHQEEHDPQAHPGQPYAEKGVRCPACRWSEVRIYHVGADDDITGTYLVHTIGRSDVEFTQASREPEVDRVRIKVVDSPLAVVESLVEVSSRNGSAYLTVASREALMQASTYDTGIATEFRTRRIQ